MFIGDSSPIPIAAIACFCSFWCQCMIGCMIFSSILFAFLKLFASGNACRHNQQGPQRCYGQGLPRILVLRDVATEFWKMELGLGVTIPKWRNNLGEWFFLKCNVINPIVNYSISHWPTIFYGIPNHRRKFRSQTSDNMDRWKAEEGRGRDKRKIRRKKSRRERVRRKKLQMREKVGKSRNTVFFPWFGAPEGRKVGSLKRRVRSQLARREMKNCTPLWREAHYQVKMYKTPQRRTTFGSCDVEKVHAVVARSTFRSQNVQSTSLSDHFWKLRCRKSARLCGTKHISKSKCTKH